jgi:hypothetical protein
MGSCGRVTLGVLPASPAVPVPMRAAPPLTPPCSQRHRRPRLLHFPHYHPRRRRFLGRRRTMLSRLEVLRVRRSTGIALTISLACLFVLLQSNVRRQQAFQLGKDPGCIETEASTSLGHLSFASHDFAMPGFLLRRASGQRSGGQWPTITRSRDRPGEAYGASDWSVVRPAGQISLVSQAGHS